MPFRRPPSPFWRIRFRHLPGYGPFPELCTYARSKKIAVQMETLVRRVAERGLESGDSSWYDLLNALRGGRRGKTGLLRLTDLLRAHHERRLDTLRLQLRDPLLGEAIEEFLRTDPSYDVRNGLRILQEMAGREFGDSPRLSVLRSGKTIMLLLALAEREGGRGGKPLARNSVVRGPKNAASLLLSFHVGASEARNIFADVSYAAEDDTRDVWLRPEELHRLLASCAAWLRPMVLFAVTTGADRAPALRLTCGDVELFYDAAEGDWAGTAFLRDRKTDARPRRVALIDPVCRDLNRLMQGKSAREAVFEGPDGDSPTPYQVRYWFDQARREAGLDHVRFKDLRRTWGVTADRAGLTLSDLQAGMGHRRQQTSIKYTKHQVVLDSQKAARVAAEMGLFEDIATRPVEQKGK